MTAYPPTSQITFVRSPDTAITVAESLSGGVRRLGAAGVKTPRQDARLLLARAMGVDHPAMLDETAALGAAAASDYECMLRRREAREPVSRILGVREFWSLKFRLNAHTFDPRPDTETVVEAVATAFCGRPAPRRILDFGTGSGCLICALLHEFPTAWGLGVDASPAALLTARRNAKANGVESRTALVVANWGSALTGKFDLIVSNPPYIASTEIAALEPEVSEYDPQFALDGGSDGLDSIRALTPHLATLAAPGAYVFVEVGKGQADGAAAYLAMAGLLPGPHATDLAGVARVATAEAAK